MKIRIVDTSIDPNIAGNANVNDTKFDQILSLYLLANGIESPVTGVERLDAVAGMLKRHMIQVAKAHLRNVREAETMAKLIQDTADFD